MRVGPHHALRPRELRPGQERLPFRPRGPAAEPAVQPQDVGELGRDGEDGVEGRARLLEDHRDAAAADPVHLPLRERQEILSAEQHPSAPDLARRPQEAHDRERRHGLAAATLSDQPGDPAGR